MFVLTLPRAATPSCDDAGPVNYSSQLLGSINQVFKKFWFSVVALCVYVFAHLRDFHSMRSRTLQLIFHPNVRWPMKTIHVYVSIT